jgi:hypothetical protein
MAILKYLNTSQAARAIGRTEKTILAWMRAGELTPIATEHKRGAGVIRWYDPVQLREVDARHRVVAPDRVLIESVSAPAILPPPVPVSLPARAPVHTQPLLQRGDEGLPEGCVSCSLAARDHHIPETTLRRWAREGQLETLDEVFPGPHGTYPIKRPLTAKGHEQLYHLARHRADFTACDGCPARN